jgi:two-component system alkaline phosphatase synthesis response regulator PhoP
LAKPFSIEGLKTEIDKLLKKRLATLLGNKKVLVVEDHEDTAELLQIQLEQVGNANVSIATNGLEALDKVREQRPDLILMDIMLPIMDGCEVTRKLKDDPQTRPIPILAVTAKVTPGDRAICLESGCDGYLPKPFMIQQLKTEITKILTRADSLRRMSH